MFDTPELLSKIAVYTGKSYSPANVYLSFTFESDNETMRFDFDREFYTYNMRTKKVKKLGEKSSCAKSDPYWMKYSPDSLFFCMRNGIICILLVMAKRTGYDPGTVNY